MKDIKLMQLTCDEYLPVICGNAWVANRFVNMMKDQNRKSIVVVDNKRDRPIYTKYEGTEVFNAPGNDATVKLSIDSIVKERDINAILVHGHNYPRFEKILKAAEYKDTLKIIVSHFLFNDVKEQIKNYDGIITFQKSQYDIYKQDIPEDKLILSPHPIDTSLLYEDKSIERISRSFLYVGRVHPIKGVHKLIPYLDQLDATYTIMGPITDDYKSQLLDLAELYDVVERINILPATLDKNILREQFNKHEIFFLASESDCYSLVLTEALACGMQAIVRHIDNAFEWTEGHIHEFKNTNDMEELLFKLINKEVEYYDTATFMKETYNYEMISKKFQKDLERMFDNKMKE